MVRAADWHDEDGETAEAFDHLSCSLWTRSCTSAEVSIRTLISQRNVV